MKYILFVFCFFTITLATWAQHSAQTLKNHRQAVAESASAQTAITSLDTLFMSGKPYATVRVFARDSQVITSQSLYSLDSGKALIEIRRMEKMNPAPGQASFLFSFPPLQLMCEVKSRSGGSDIYATIQQYGLLGTHGLDTVKAEMFVILKGKINTVDIDGQKQQVETRQEAIAEKSYIVPRDTRQPLLFSEDENIAQGGAVIGRFKEDVAQTPYGTVRKISIYNSIGALICTATQTKPGGAEWRLLTYRDNKFLPMTSKSSNDKEEVALLLIRLGLL